MQHKVFTTTAYRFMGEKLCGHKNYTPGKLTVNTFPEGEKYFHFDESVREQRVVLIGGTTCEADTLELYDIASGLVDYGCTTLTIFIPYFGYSTQERAIHKGDVVVAKGRARLFSSIPSARQNNRIYLLDLHTAGIAHYFEGSLYCRHLSSKELVVGIVRGLGKPEEVVIACTDAGRAKWVEGLANFAGTEAAFVYKRRLSETQTTVSGVNADVKGKHVALYDDMIRSGSSFIKAAEAYKKAGAQSITGIASHCVFHGDTLAKLQSSNMFTKVHMTNSHPLAIEAAQAAPEFIQIHDVMGLFEQHYE